MSERGPNAFLGPAPAFAERGASGAASVRQSRRFWPRDISRWLDGHARSFLCRGPRVSRPQSGRLCRGLRTQAANTKAIALAAKLVERSCAFRCDFLERPLSQIMCLTRMGERERRNRRTASGLALLTVAKPPVRAFLRRVARRRKARQLFSGRLRQAFPVAMRASQGTLFY